VQDALFLADYARALALCGARASAVDDLRMFCRHAAEAIDVERDLHARLMGELGIDAAEAAAEPTPACRGYTSFLLQACALGDRHEALAAVLPCYWIYWEVGRALAARGSPDPRYRAWIDTYAGDEFAAAARGAIDAADRALAGASAPELDAARRQAVTAARYEWMFWDSAWRGESWGPPS
jgi:thiaminase/transcriptional activator TenA